MAATVTTNAPLTITAVTREALRILKNNLQFAMTCARPTENLWNMAGRKAGTTIEVRKPSRYTVTASSTASYQATIEKYVNLTLSQAHVATAFTLVELQTSLNDYSKQVLAPKMEALYNYVDYTGLGYFVKVANSTGTIGTPPSTATDLLTAGAIITENGGPNDGQRYCALNPAANAAMVNGLKGLYESQSKIREQFETGKVADNVYGFGKIYETANVHTHTTGTADSTYAVNDTVADGDVDITFKTGSGTITAGDVLTFANCYNVNPQNRASTGRLKQVVVDTTYTPGGAGTPSIDAVALGGQHAWYETGAFQNCNALPADSAAIYIAGENEALSGVTGGTASAANTSPQNLAYHRDAFMFGCIPLAQALPGALFRTESSDGVILNFTAQHNIDESENKARFDVLFGFAACYPELACRIWG